MIGRLPGTVRWHLGRGLGDLLFVLVPSRRRIVLANLARAFPDLSRSERSELCRRFYRHLGLMLVELCGLLVQPIERALLHITLDGLEHLERVVAAHGRALILTAHLGNWELLTAASRLTGFRLATVVRPLDVPVLDRLAQRLRERTGVGLIDKRRAFRPILNALGRGDLVGILLDQNATRDEAVFVPFFGVLASTSKSIAVLALRTGTPVVPVFIRREDQTQHRVVIHPPLVLPTARGAAAIVELTTHCTAAIEAAIRETPEQWLWIHDRWRTRPPAVKPA